MRCSRLRTSHCAKLFDCYNFSFTVQDVPRLPSLKQGNGVVRHPAGVLLDELDIYIDCLSQAITAFAETSANALEGAAELQELNERIDTDVDIMPRDEVFLISSFLLNIRLAA